MGRKYDLSNVTETQFLNQAGEFTLKVVSVKQEFTAYNNPVEKVTFQTREGEQIGDEFVVTDKALWKMKLFIKALKLAPVVDTDEWIGRYVVATVVKESFTRQDQTRGEKFVISKYAPPRITNSVETLNVVPVERTSAPDVPERAPMPQSNLPQIDINEDEIPF